MDPPEETDAAPPHRRRQRRRGDALHIQWTLLFTVSFVILSLFKLEPIARNSLRDHNVEIDAPHNNEEDVTKEMQVPVNFGFGINRDADHSARFFEWKCHDSCSCLPMKTNHNNNDTSSTIFMHQSYSSADPQTWHWGWKSQRQTWIDLHPNWHFVFWNDEQNSLLANCTGFGDVLEERSGIQQADLSRLLYMHHYGGLYVDMDYVALRDHHHLFSLDQKQINLQQILLQGRKDQVIGFEWGFARNSGHPLWAFCLNMARGQKGRQKRQGCPIWFTGPWFLNRCVKKYFKQRNQELSHMMPYGKNELMILDPELIAPIRGDDFQSDCGKWRNITAAEEKKDKGGNESIWIEMWPKSSCMQYLNEIGSYAVTLYSHSWGDGLKC